jgi:hypothetical protein
MASGDAARPGKGSKPPPESGECRQFGRVGTHGSAQQLKIQPSPPSSAKGAIPGGLALGAALV